MTQNDILEIIRKWKFFWMNQKQNSEEDFQNYFTRAVGIDSNMKHDLADRLFKEIEGLSNDRHLLDEANIDLNHKVIAYEKALQYYAQKWADPSHERCAFKARRVLEKYK